MVLVPKNNRNRNYNNTVHTFVLAWKPKEEHEQTRNNIITGEWHNLLVRHAKKLFNNLWEIKIKWISVCMYANKVKLDQ